MKTVKMHRWPDGVPFVGGKPGDFQFSDREQDPGATPPKWFHFQCPEGRGECCIPIRPNATSKGASWEWDKNREAPTFSPSINCLAHNPKNPAEKYAGCGWHGHIVAGVMSNVPDHWPVKR